MIIFYFSFSLRRFLTFIQNEWSCLKSISCWIHSSDNEILCYTVEKWPKMKMLCLWKISSYSQNHQAPWNWYFTVGIISFCRVLLFTLSFLQRETCFLCTGSKSFKINPLAGKWRCDFNMSEVTIWKG